MNVAVAVSCTVLPRVTVAPAEVQLSDPEAQLMAIDFTATLEMVKVVCALFEPSVALMVVEPSATAVASPALLMVATEGADEVQVEALVTSCVFRLPKVAVAVNCWVFFVPAELFSAMVGFTGDKAIEAMELASTKKSPQLSSSARLSSSATVPPTLILDGLCIRSQHSGAK